MILDVAMVLVAICPPVMPAELLIFEFVIVPAAIFELVIVPAAIFDPVTVAEAIFDPVIPELYQ